MRLLSLAFAITIFLLLPHLSDAQKVQNPAAETDWTIFRIAADYEHFGDMVGMPTYGRHNLRVNDKEQIVPVLVGKYNWAIVKVNSAGKELWRSVETKGYIFGMSWLGDKVAVVTSPGWYNDITVTLFDTKKGTQVAQKVVFTSERRASYRIRVQNRPDGQLNNLLVYDVQKKITPHGIILNDDLSVKKVIDFAVINEETEIAGAIVNPAGEFFMAQFHDESFEVKKYSAEGKEVKALSVPVERKNKRYFTILQLSNDGTGVIAAAKYNQSKKENVLTVFRFDFNAGKASASAPRILDADAAKTAGLQTVKGIKEGSFKEMDHSKPQALFQSGNQVIVLTQISHYELDSRGRLHQHYEEAWMVSFYDRDLKFKSATGIDKVGGSFTEAGLSIGYHQYGNKLIILSPALRGAGQSALTYGEIDLATGKLQKASLLEELNSGAAATTECGSTIWFDQSYLIEQISGKMFSAVIRGTHYPVLVD